MDKLIVVLPVLAYLIISYRILILRKPGNFVSWLLWTLLDGIIIYNGVLTHTLTPLIKVFTVGTGFVALVLLIKGDFSFGKAEYLSIGLVIVCVGINATATPTVALIAGSLASGIAGIPYLIDLYNDGSDRLGRWVAFLFFACSFLTLYSVRGHGLEGLVFPCICTMYWLLAWITASARRDYEVALEKK